MGGPSCTTTTYNAKLHTQSSLLDQEICRRAVAHSIHWSLVRPRVHLASQQPLPSSTWNVPRGWPKLFQQPSGSPSHYSRGSGVTTSSSIGWPLCETACLLTQLQPTLLRHSRRIVLALVKINKCNTAFLPFDNLCIFNLLEF